MKCHFEGHRGKRVGGIGPRRAPVVLLGEALGKDEEREGEPFIGAAGRFLWEGRDWSGQTRWPGLEEWGLPRASVRIENVIETRPPDNQLWRLNPSDVAQWQEDWWERFERLEPTVVVPMGNLALNTLRRTPLPLTQKGKWRMRSSPMGPQIDWQDKIHNWRGSIFYVRANNGERVKCIPNFHPSYILRAGQDYDCWKDTWTRIVEDKEFPELRLDPRCEHLIDPTPKDVHHFQMMVNAAYLRAVKDAVLAVDIETLAGGKVVDLIGFSLDEKFSITLTMKDEGMWQAARSLLKHPVAKGWHYRVYDQYVLWRKGVHIANSRWDSHQLHHMLDPRDDHSLGYCASRDLRVRYWKHENKEDGKATVVKDPRRRKKYNGKDVCYTRALITKYIERARALGILPQYHAHYRQLTNACIRLTQVGFNTDNEARKDIERREGKALVKTLRQIDQMAYPIQPSPVVKLRQDGTPYKRQKAFKQLTMVGEEGGLSPQKVTRYFYDTLGCKPFFKRGSGNRTADELAVRRLMRKYKKARPMGNLILAYRGHGKLKQEVRASIVSEDGRLRSRYSPTTDTGRLRAAKVSEEEGINAQNRDRKSDLRRMFIADPGQVLVEWDQSQAEDRIASGMSGDREATRLARMKPHEIDKHIYNACKIFDEWEYEELLAAYKAGDPDADQARQTGKRTKYACWYGMEGPRMAEITLVETEGAVVLDADECDEWITRLKTGDKSIEKYQHWISADLLDFGKLTSSWGRTVYFKGLRLSREDHKQAWAWRAQHEVGVNTNQLGFVPCDRGIQTGRWPGARIVQQGHDSLIVTVPPRWAYSIANFLSTSMGQEREYPGAGGLWKLSMPIGVKVGHNWKEMTEWKELPAREVFEKAMRRYL